MGYLEQRLANMAGVPTCPECGRPVMREYEQEYHRKLSALGEERDLGEGPCLQDETVFIHGWF